MPNDDKIDKNARSAEHDHSDASGLRSSEQHVIPRMDHTATADQSDDHTDHSEKLTAQAAAEAANTAKPSSTATPHSATESVLASASELSSNTPFSDDEQVEVTSNHPGGDTAEPRAGRFAGLGGIGKALLSWVITPIAIVLLLHSFVFQAFYVSGSSMEPSFHDGNYLIISKIEHTFGLGYHRGDVMVFRYPNSPSTYFIKRLIGLPGDRVVIKDGKVTVYSKGSGTALVLKEDYIDPSQTTVGDIDMVVQNGNLFVLGDNRHPDGSFDSRSWGLLPMYDVIGKATMQLLPLGNFGLISDPKY